MAVITTSYRRRPAGRRPVGEAPAVDHDVDQTDVGLAKDVPWL